MRIELIYKVTHLEENDYYMDDIEEFLEELLSEHTFAEVTGAGSSEDLCNFDIELEKEHVPKLLDLLKNKKEQLLLTPEVEIRGVYEGKESFFSIE